MKEIVVSLMIFYVIFVTRKIGEGTLANASDRFRNA